MNPYKERFAKDTPLRTLAEAVKGADVLLGLSKKGAFTPEMIASLAPRPVVFAMANPDPEITYEEAQSGPRRHHHGHRTLRLSQPGQQCSRLPLHLPRRSRRACHHHQRGNEAGGHPCPGGAGQGRRSRLGLPRLRCETLEVWRRLHHPQAVRSARAGVGGGSRCQGGHGHRRSAESGGHRRIPRATGEAAGQGARTDAHHDSQGAGQSQARGFPGGLAPEDPARLPCADGGEDRHSGAAGPQPTRSSARRRSWACRWKASWSSSPRPRPGARSMSGSCIACGSAAA